MNKTRAALAAHAIVAAAAFGTAQGQTVDQIGALSNFVNNPETGASELQRDAGYAVQGMCRALATEGALLLRGQKGDLYARCNEMVETARVFEDLPGTRDRTLGYTDRTQLTAAVQQVSGEELAAQGVLSTKVSSGQFANISGRLSALRVGTMSSAARGRVASLEEPAPSARIPVLALRAQDEQQPTGISPQSETPASESRLGWFFESSYGFGDHDQTVNEDAFDFDSTSVTSGLDYNFGNSVLGFSIGYDRYSADFDTALLVSGGEVKVDGVSGSVFGGWFGGGWTVNGIATYGSLDSEVTRRTVYASENAACFPACGASRTLKGEPDGDYFALGVTLGYEFFAGDWEIAPALSGSYRDVSIDGYDEIDTAPDGGLALRYEEQSIESMRTILSLAIARPFSRSFGVLVPTLRLEWHHEFEDDLRTVGAKYVLEDSLLANASSSQDFGCSISCFRMPVDRADSDFGIGSLGLSVTLPRRVQLYLVYEGLIGAADLTGNSIAAGLRGQF